jgi:hypothetical protein
MKLKSSKYKNKSFAITNISSKSKNETLLAMSNPEEENNLKDGKKKRVARKDSPSVLVYFNSS